jgi:hypothetical protein
MTIRLVHGNFHEGLLPVPANFPVHRLIRLTHPGMRDAYYRIEPDSIANGTARAHYVSELMVGVEDALPIPATRVVF